MNASIESSTLWRMTNSSRVLAVSAGFGILAEVLLNGREWGINYGIVALLLVTLIIKTTSKERRQAHAQSVWLLWVSVALMFCCAINAAPWLNRMNVITACTLFSVALVQLAEKSQLAQHRISQMFVRPFRAVAKAMINTVVSLTAWANEIQWPKSTPDYFAKSLRLMFIVVPPVGVVVALLSSSDSRFAQHISDLFSSIFDIEILPTMARICWMFIAACFALGILISANEKSRPETTQGTLFQIRSVEAIALVVGLSMAIGAWSLSRLECTISREACETQVYSQLAHQGFYELLAVACIILAIVSAVEPRAHFTPMSRKIYQASTTFLTALTLAMVWQAHTRISLYVETYGFTVLRILAQAGLVAVAVWMVLRVATLFVAQKHFVFAALLTWGFVQIGLAVSRPEWRIATHNLSHEQLDCAYLCTLSSDAHRVPGFDRLGCHTETASRGIFEWNFSDMAN
jgi:uncharacterized membrane protein